MQRYFYECVFESMEIYGYVALHMVNSHVSSYDISHEVLDETFSYLPTAQDSNKT